jgi:hypothetical protein
MRPSEDTHADTNDLERPWWVWRDTVQLIWQCGESVRVRVLAPPDTRVDGAWLTRRGRGHFWRTSTSLRPQNTRAITSSAHAPPRHMSPIRQRSVMIWRVTATCASPLHTLTPPPRVPRPHPPNDDCGPMESRLARVEGVGGGEGEARGGMEGHSRVRVPG